MGSTAQAPLLGGSPEQREAFREYTVCFSTQDFENIRKFFTDDIRLELGDVATLDGPEAFIEFYRNQAKSVRETLTINHMVADEGGIVADITATFTGVAEKPIPGSMWLLEKGQSVAGRFFVYYLLRDGKIYSIKVATVEQPQPVN